MGPYRVWVREGGRNKSIHEANVFCVWIFCGASVEEGIVIIKGSK